MKFVFSLMSVCFVLSSVASAQVQLPFHAELAPTPAPLKPAPTPVDPKTIEHKWVSTNTVTSFTAYGDVTYQLVRRNDAGYDVFMSEGAQLNTKNTTTLTQTSEYPNVSGTLFVSTPFENIRNCLNSQMHPDISGGFYYEASKSQRDFLMVVRIIEDQAKSINLETKNELNRRLKINEAALKKKIITGSCESALNTWIKDFNQRNH